MTESSGGERPGMPRWVKAFLIAGVVIVVLLMVMLLSGHGPGRHMHHGLHPLLPAGAGSAGW